MWVTGRLLALWFVPGNAAPTPSDTDLPLERAMPVIGAVERKGGRGIAVAPPAVAIAKEGRKAPRQREGAPRATIDRPLNKLRVAEQPSEQRSPETDNDPTPTPPATLTGAKRSGGTEDMLPNALSLAPLTSPVAEQTPSASPKRLAGSVWLVARNGSYPAISVGLLGGSQAGVRLTYRVGDSPRLALSARLATPLASRGTEGAVGLDWQPMRWPVHVIAENRFALDHGRGGATLGVVGGVGPQAVTPGVTIEGYAQAGLIGRRRPDGFADGSLRLTTSVHTGHGSGIALGLGVWGGVQREAVRLDLGPTLVMALPVGERRLRLAADWRQRIAGRARPGSGLAVGLGSDF